MEIILTIIAGVAFGVFIGWVIARNKHNELYNTIDKLKWQLDGEKANAELERLKDKVEKECKYGNLDKEERKEIETRVKKLRKTGCSLRLACCIILLEKNISISTDTISKICKFSFF